jgi:hypothetical protein
MDTGHEPKSTSTLEPSLLNFYDVICDPTVPMTDFGGFDGGGDIECATGVMDSCERWWMDAFGPREDSWADWKS